MQRYILVMRDTRYWLDPRWQSIQLADPHAPPVVLTPAEATARAVRDLPASGAEG